MAKGDRFWRIEAQKDALRAAEKAGEVADSMAVRQALVERMNAGELTLEQVQDELARIKREAKKSGRATRDSFFKR